jgi:hypothetical protein
MCSLALALTGLSTGLSAVGQYQQGKAQAAAYEAQAEAAYQNAKIQNKKSELMADQYAQKQRELDDRRRLVTGQQIAAAGASGISSNVGSPLDVYTASMDAWGQDTVNLLTDQRNDQWSNYVNEVNYRNQGNAAMANAKAAKQAGTIGAISTLLGGAASMYGMKGGSSAASAEPTAYYSGPGVGSAGYLTGNAAINAGKKAFGSTLKMGSRMPAWTSSYNYYGV